MAGRSDIIAGKAFIELALRGGAAVQKGLRDASNHLKDFGAGAQVVGGIMTGVGAAIAAPLVAATKTFLDTGDALDKMRQRTGLSVEALSELGHAAEQSGSSLDEVEAAVKKMQKGIGDAADGGKEAHKAFNDIGLSATALAAMSPEKQFEAVADAIGKIPRQADRVEAAMSIFGKAGTKLLPMLEDLGALRKEAQDMGFVMSGEAAASAVKLGDMLANLWKTVKFGGIAIGGALAPALTQAVQWFQKVATSAMDWVKANGPLFATIAKVAAALVAAGAAITGFGLAMSAAGIAVGGIATGLGVLASVATALVIPLTVSVGIFKALTAVVAAVRAVVISAAAGLAVFQVASTAVSVSIGLMGSALGAAASVTASVRAAILSLAASQTVLATASKMLAAVQAGLRAAMLAVRGAILSVAVTQGVLAKLTAAYTAALGMARTAWAAIRGAILTTAAVQGTYNVVSAATAGIMGILSGGLGLLRAAFIGVASGATLAKIATLAFTAVGTALGAVFSVLTSPALLVGAGLVALGLAAWKAVGGFDGLKSAASSAFSFISDIASELLPTIKETFGGISDAISAGELALAGEIAMAGLQVALLQGVQAIADSVGGAFGEFLSTLGTQLASGDFAGAWETSIAGIKKIWADFLLGAFDLFMGFVNSIRGAFQSAIDGIASGIVGLAKKFPELGKLALGVDVAAEGERGTKLDRSQVEAKQRILETAREDLKKTEAAGGTRMEDGREQTSEGLKILIADLEKQLASAGAVADDGASAWDSFRVAVGDFANKAVDFGKQTADALDPASIRAGLTDLRAGLEEDRDAANKDLAEKTEDGMAKLPDALAKAQEKLDALAKLAEKKAAEAKQATETKKEDTKAKLGAAASTSTAERVQGTFSAAAALSMGNGGMMAPVVKAVKDAAEKADEKQAKRDKMLRDIIAAGGRLV